MSEDHRPTKVIELPLKTNPTTGAVVIGVEDDAAIRIPFQTFLDLVPETLLQAITALQEESQSLAEAMEEAVEETEASALAAAASATKLRGTSASNVAIGTGERIFLTQTSKEFAPGATILATSASDPVGRWVNGISTGYDGSGNLTLNVVKAQGSGTYADWTLRVAGPPGADGDMVGPETSSVDEVALFGSTIGNSLKRSNLIFSVLGKLLAAAASPAAGRAALELGTAAVLATGVAAGNVPVLDGSGKLTTGVMPESILGGVNYQGIWNATTNSPAIPAAATGNKGWYYIVGTAGTTTIDGVNDWQLGDWIISNGSVWSKVDSSDQITLVAGLSGNISAANLKTALSLVTADIGGLVSTLAGKEAKWARAFVATNTAAVDHTHYVVDSSAAARTITLPAVLGAKVRVERRGANSVFVARNGYVMVNKTTGALVAEDFEIDVNLQWFEFELIDAATDYWEWY